MLRASDRSHSRRDTAALLVCAALSFVVLLFSDTLGRSIASRLRESVLAPLVALQSRAAEARTSRARFRAVTTQRDSAALAAQAAPILRAENLRLRDLLALSRRLGVAHITAEVLHQSQASDGRMLLLDVGTADGAAEWHPVIAPEGLIGVINSASSNTATVMTWAHPDFRISSFTADGRVFGIVAAASGSVASEASLEFRAASYRDTLALGTVVLSSGLGGVYPKGIPVGTVTGVAREQAGWERVYSLRPAGIPSTVAHVMVLTGSATPAAAAFPSDSILAAVRADSLRRQASADSALRVRIADSVRAVLQDGRGVPTTPNLSPARPPQP